jgi:Family of unknown function (DUF6370)
MLRISMLTLSLALVVGLATTMAEEKKEVTLKGTITCAKCDLKKEAKCATVIKVTKDGKDTVYYFDADMHKKYHGDICNEPKEGTVTGTVKKDGEKMIVTVSKLEYK